MPRQQKNPRLTREPTEAWLAGRGLPLLLANPRDERPDGPSVALERTRALHICIGSSGPWWARQAAVTDMPAGHMPTYDSLGVVRRRAGDDCERQFPHWIWNHYRPLRERK